MHGIAIACIRIQFWVTGSEPIMGQTYWVTQISKSDPIAMLVETIVNQQIAIICLQLLEELPQYNYYIFKMPSDLILEWVVLIFPGGMPQTTLAIACSLLIA